MVGVCGAGARLRLVLGGRYQAFLEKRTPAFRAA